MGPFRLLAIHAHPDDEASKGAATLARYAAEGQEVMVATLTGGERGDVLNPTMTDPRMREHLRELRVEEMAASAAALGVQHRWLGFVDSGYPGDDSPEPLPEGSFATLDPYEAAGPLVALMREFRPHVVLTYDETGGYPHPDHIQTHRVSMVAWAKSGEASEFVDAGEPWEPRKLYFDRNLTRERFLAFHEAMMVRDQESPYSELLGRWGAERGGGYDRITTKVNCAEYYPQRDKALRAHASQIDPRSPFFFPPMEIQQEAWPWEMYELAATRVVATLPEQDLFAGIASA